jgi:hypothetical protein
MILASLPFDYLQHLDPHDRVRRKRTRPTDRRVRRGTPSASGE